VSPFWEDDLHEVVSFLGTEHVCFGSDYPHPEGLAEPREYEKLAAELDDEAGARRIMYENTLALTTLY
jgi:microsomal dipeptidase-like Zn-dependent dipeptidase